MCGVVQCKEYLSMKKFFSLTIGLTLVFSLAVAPFLLPHRTMAATITTFSDALTRIKASTAANHEIFFVTPTGVASTQTVTVTFSADFTGVGSIIEDDVDFASGSTATCTSATYTEQATVASGATSAQWNVSASGSVITIESGGASATVSSNKCIRIRIGTNAASSGTGVNQISSGAADDDDTVVIGGTFGDSGTATIDIIADDQVVITATVAPTFTFTIDDNAIGFGTLSSSSAVYATANAAGSGSDSVANSFTVATNAASGYTLTYNGATLTSGGNTISAATITADANGTPGSEQFAISATVTGTGTVASGYDHANPDWKFTAGATTTLASATAPVSSDTVAIRYLANISGATEPGSYTTTLTYVATGNF